MGTDQTGEREMLEAAARAAGVDGRYFYSDNPIHCGIYQARGEYYWNPLASDSENRRLQVKLRLGLIPVEGGGWDATRYDSERCSEVTLASDSDPNRAVVRAAASLGRAAASTAPGRSDRTKRNACDRHSPMGRGSAG